MHLEDRGAIAQPPESAESRPLATQADAVHMCSRLASGIGASGFGLFFLAAQSEARRLAPVFDHTFPGVSPASRALSAQAAAGFARHIADSLCPLWWRAENEAPFLSAAARCWAEEVRPPAAGQSGIAFPVSVEHGRAGAVVFIGSAMTIGEDELCDIHALCFDLFAEVARQRTEDCDEPRPMSKREIECLRLTAHGLTSDEIAAALGLSVHTANQYLTNSTHKLNAVNRIHAVAKALRCGLIA